MLNFKIIAVDFDGTLCENKWPEIGEPNLELIKHLKKEKAAGAKIILWTCRVDYSLEMAINWCHAHSLEFDAVNENLPEVINEFGSDTRKIFANEYIDDKMHGRFGLPFVNEEINIPITASSTVPLNAIRHSLGFCDIHNQASSKDITLGTEDIKAIENFVTRDGPFMELKEMQAVVRMQYDLYKRMMKRTWVVHRNIFVERDGG